VKAAREAAKEEKEQRKAAAKTRSHEQLRALDALVALGLSYPGWEADVEEAERYHVECPSLFDQFLAQMTKRQSMQQGDRSHEQLRALDALVASGLTYPGWEADVKEAETNHVNYPTSFDRFLAEMQKKQSKQPGGSSKIRQEKRKASAQKRRRVTPSSPSREKPQTC